MQAVLYMQRHNNVLECNSELPVLGLWGTTKVIFCSVLTSTEDRAKLCLWLPGSHSLFILGMVLQERYSLPSGFLSAMGCYKPCCYRCTISSMHDAKAPNEAFGDHRQTESCAKLTGTADIAECTGTQADKFDACHLQTSSCFAQQQVILAMLAGSSPH